MDMHAMAAAAKFVLSLILLLFDFQHGICLELDFNRHVYSTQHEEALLRCGVVTDLTIKQVVWYKLSGSSQQTVYYYEPSSFIDRANLERASRSPTDSTSLSIYPALLMDEGTYTCHVEVWDRLAVTNSTLDKLASIPIETDAKMKLIVNVPPSENVQLIELLNGNNMTLTCKATNAKPAAEITWLKTTPDGREEELKTPSQKMIVEDHDKLSDTTVHIYYSLSTTEKATKISCVVKHPDTNTVFYRNVTIVSPAIQHAVKIFLNRLGETVAYSSLENQESGDIGDVSGLVKISADPGLRVPFNSSVTLTASAPGVFPNPNFVWWTGERAAIHGPELYIPTLENNAEYYVLAQNPAGKVLLSVPLTVVNAGYEKEENTNGTETGDNDDNKHPVGTAGLNGGLIAAIVIGSLLFCLLIGLTIWCRACKNPTNKGMQAGKPSRKDIKKHEEKEDGFVHSGKPLMRTTSTQTLEGRRGKKDPPHPAKSEDNLLSSSSRKSGRKHTPPPEYATKERPMAQHLKEYGESASFVEEYGPGDGLDSASSAENLHSAHEAGGDSQSERSIPVSEDVV